MSGLAGVGPAAGAGGGVPAGPRREGPGAGGMLSPGCLCPEVGWDLEAV